MTGQVQAICFPPDDDRFIGRVREFLTATGEPDEPLRATVEALIRQSCPLAVVSARHPLPRLDQRPTWFVFRDGSASAMPPDPSDEDPASTR